jgi:hypothetical protein
MNLIGGGTNIDANHIPAAIENPIEYLVVVQSIKDADGNELLKAQQQAIQQKPK